MDTQSPEPTRSVVRCITIGLGAILLIVAVGWLIVTKGLGFSFFPARSATMAPLISGPAAGYQTGDIAVFQRRFDPATLKSNDVVWVQVVLDGHELDLARQVLAVGDDPYPAFVETNAEARLPQHTVFIRGAGTAIDSRVLGPVRETCIRGRLAFVIPTGKCMKAFQNLARSQP